MPASSEAHPSGAPHLGPHVVGTRVVVRRVVRRPGADGGPGEVETGPSGGPALTDVLGTCLAWGEGVCVVQPADGEPVTIPVADIVAGKPVPPRASVRQRVSAREAEGHSFVLFPDVERRDVGEWVLRSDPAPIGRLYKRANSALAMGDPGCSFAEAERAVLDFYAKRGRDPMVSVEADGDVEAAFRERGWGPYPHGEVEFRLGSLVAVRRARRGRGRGLGVVALEGDRDERVHVVVPGTAEPRAEGRGAVHGDWLGLNGLRTRLEHRRQGLAGEVLDALLEWGAERGAMTVWLHVESDNPAARALYDGLGLAVHHVTRYLVPGDAG
ncbi:GNAT superfamily N-acetyltransferase [Nocardioides marinisabuli]|uniref:GNAT superfamily N-acetyltransferase n=1 Tax=Nocardioides marinisabuli TaxID=419476 RepID=A0A7Y9JR71_9ACTN|nr:GNAT family N-acetyltransferase [Nocardioides marinisabuli]NYD57951.1 GNAT superfamily N-acetyltransferase [Nocardioides marinisabuli]